MGAGKVDALGGIRMAREEVQALVGFGIDRHETAVGRHGVEEAGGGIGIVAGFAEHAHADDIGLQLLLAGEGGEPELAAGERLFAGDIAGEDLGDDAAGDDLRFFALLPLDAWFAVTWPISCDNTAATSEASLARASRPRVT